MGTITSHPPTPLEELINQGYKEKGRTKDRQCVVLENQEGGIVYDIQRDKIIARYPFETWQRQRKY